MAKKSALAVLRSSQQWEEAEFAADDIVSELAESALRNPQLLKKTESSKGAYLAVAARHLAIDTLRRARRYRSLDALIHDDIDGGDRDDVVATLAANSSKESPLTVPGADIAYSVQEIEEAAEEHARLDRWFTRWVRHRLARRTTRDRRLRRRLSTGARPAIIRALFDRPSFLATLLHESRRDVYEQASEEAGRLSRETGLSLGRVRNLRTELIDLLRVELSDEVGSVLSRLATLWDTTLEGARDLHLRWAEAA